MTGIEVARAVVAQRQCHLFRPALGRPGEYDARPYGSGSKCGWVALDLFSAGAIATVYDALKPENQAKFASFPIQMMARVAFKLIA